VGIGGPIGAIVQNSVTITATSSLPVTFSGTQTVTGSVGIGGPLPVVGVNGPVVITGSVGVDNNISVQFSKANSSSVTNVAASTVNVTLLAANPARIGGAIYNDSVNVMYLKLGATASTTSYTVQLGRRDYYELPSGYTGQVDALWSASAGTARITELT
jgi:hypothetical protein